MCWNCVQKGETISLCIRRVNLRVICPQLAVSTSRSDPVAKMFARKMLPYLVSLLFFISPSQNQAKIPCICKDLLVAWRWLTLLVLLFCLHFIETPDVLFGFRGSNLNEENKLLRIKILNTEFFWACSKTPKSKYVCLLPLYFQTLSNLIILTLIIHMN